MKKLITILLIGTLVLASSVYAFAEDTTTCELDPAVAERLLEIKDEFIAEKIQDGTLTQLEADELLSNLASKTGHDELRDLGFGVWLHENDYMDELFDLLPRKGKGGEGKGGSVRGEFNTENIEAREARRAEMGGFANYDDLTEEQKAEIDARHAERLEQMENGEFGFGSRVKGRGRNR